MADSLEMSVSKLLGKSWMEQLVETFRTKAMTHVQNHILTSPFFPARFNIFRAYMFTQYCDVKVVVLGKSMYNEDNAGLAFSCLKKANATTRNFWAGMDADLGFGDYLGNTSNFAYMSERGIMLLDVALTTAPGKEQEHIDAWRPFLEATVTALNKREQSVCFILLGAEGQYFKKFIDPLNHLVLEADSPEYEEGNESWNANACFSRSRIFIEDNYGKVQSW